MLWAGEWEEETFEMHQNILFFLARLEKLLPESNLLKPKRPRGREVPNSNPSHPVPPKREQLRSTGEVHNPATQAHRN